MTFTFSRLSPASRYVLLVAGVLIVARLGAGSLNVYQLWGDGRSQAQDNTRHLGAVITEQTARTIQAVGMVMRDVETNFQEAGVNTLEALRTAAAPRAFHDALAMRMKDLPQAQAISVIDSQGQMLSISRAWPTPTFDLSGWDFFHFCHDQQTNEDFVTPLTKSPGTAEPVFYLAHCLSAPDGKFLGLVLASFRQRYFQKYFMSLGLADGSSVTLLRRDGQVLLHYPSGAGGGMQKMLPDDQWHDLVAQGGGDFQGSELATDRHSFISAHPVPGFPIVVAVGVSTKVALALWRQQAAWQWLSMACALTCLLVMALALLWQFRRFEFSQSTLARRNAALVAVQERLEAQATVLTQTANALRDSQATLARQTEALGTTLEHMDQGLMMITADRIVAVCNRRAMDILDLPPELMDAHPSFATVLARQWEREEFIFTPNDIKNFIRNGAIIDQPYTYQRQRPNGRFIEVCSVPLAGGGMVRTYTDITERKRAEEELTHYAYHDELTHLANRVVFHERLDAAIEAARQNDRQFAVLYLDLDRFKLVNDTYGHAVGDKLLIQVARRMQGGMRTGDTVARIGGDEFAIILPDGADRELALLFAQRIQAQISEPYVVDTVDCHIGVSIGIAIYPIDGEVATTLVRSADSALYRAKAAGRNAVRYHEADAERVDRGHVFTELDLRQALELQQFELVYQPVFGIDCGVPHSFEALLRWRHPEYGLLQPGSFIPLAEQCGLIGRLGDWVMQTACTEAAIWALPVRLAVNLSLAQLQQDSLDLRIAQILADTGLAPDRLDLELPEGVLLSAHVTLHATMQALRDLDIRLVLDDIGAAPSSLTGLAPFQQIKIDRAFIAQINQSEEAKSVVQAALTAAAQARVEVVAGGVETLAQLDTLRGMGCRQVQGFLLGKPQTPEWTRDYLWRCHTQRSVSAG